MLTVTSWLVVCGRCGRVEAVERPVGTVGRCVACGDRDVEAVELPARAKAPVLDFRPQSA